MGTIVFVKAVTGHWLCDGTSVTTCQMKYTLLLSHGGSTTLCMNCCETSPCYIIIMIDDVVFTVGYTNVHHSFTVCLPGG